ncbi:ABC transporter ATP-binding protein [Bacillus cereus group sp. BfR-BA-01441]|uniref:ABC transporter ATP-binding protein n=1 Tax=Bacillus cereus group sp. BfR-BA-01441 TaxID=2920348 RepID=UPI001F579DCD
MFQEIYKKFFITVIISMKVIKTIHKISPLYLFITVALTIFSGISPLVLIYISQNLINSIVSDVQNNWITIQPFIYLAIQLLYLFFEKTLFHFEKIFSYRMLQQVEYYFKYNIYEKSIDLSLIFFDDPENYNTLIKSTSSMGERSCELIRNIFSTIQASITITSFLVALMYIHWGLALSMILIVIIVAIVNTNVAKKNYNQFLDQILRIRKLEYIEGLFRGKEVAKEMKIFNHGRYIVTKWKNLYWECADEKYELEKNTNKKLYGTIFFQICCNSVFIGILIFYTVNKKINIGQFVALLQMISSSIGITNQLSTSIGSIYRESLFVSEFFEFKKRYLNDSNNEVKINYDPTLYKNIKIDVHNISFKYPNQDYLVINDISFEIKPGSKVAIVGRNGAGKSTLIKCLTGLYNVSTGQVLYNNMPVTNEVRQKTVSAIFQDFCKYEMSFLENICFTNSIKDADYSKLNEVTHLSDANTILEKYNMGYENLIGPTLNGKDLSGGEWQKIALSRAMYKDSEIIILDEPTAALDPISEAKIIDKFYEISEGKTAIFVTHRLGSCVNADLILVLKDGKLVEKGTHSQLLNLNGEYTELFNMQAKWYKKESNLQKN